MNLFILRKLKNPDFRPAFFCVVPLGVWGSWKDDTPPDQIAFREHFCGLLNTFESFRGFYAIREELGAGGTIQVMFF